MLIKGASYSGRDFSLLWMLLIRAGIDVMPYGVAVCIVHAIIIYFFENIVVLVVRFLLGE